MITEPHSLSLRAKISLGSLVVVLGVWSLLAGMSYVATNMLIDLTSDRLFKSVSHEVSLEVESALRPLLTTTSLISENRLGSASTFEERMGSGALLQAVLKQAESASAVLAGYGNGDHFMFRKLTSSALREKLNAPEAAVFAVDHSYGDRRELPFRRFLDKDLNPVREDALEDYTFDPRVRPWFQSAMDSNSVIVTSPYIFYSSQDVGITIAKKNVKGDAVLAMDVTLSSLSEGLSKTLITPNTNILLRNQNGLIAWNGGSPMVGEGESLRQRRLSDLDSSLFLALSSEASSDEWMVHHENVELVLNKDVDLLIGVPRDEFLVQLKSIRTQILFYSFVLLALLVPMSWWLSNRLTQPIRELHEAVAKVDKETFQLTLPPVRSNDEIGTLNRALLTMSQALQHYINDLEIAITARQKLENEMDIARRIQMELVPGGGQLAQNIATDTIFATLLPAKAVGGDLYDFSHLSDGRYFIAVGDVSGKGMPAALFMSRAVALSRILVPRSASAGDFLAQANNELVKGNDSCMFITMFCGFYDPKTGKLQYASAGHNPPVLFGKNRETIFVDSENGPTLGVFEDSQYPDHTLTLASGEELCIYTDGITEAFNPEAEEFSEERLKSFIQSLDSYSEVREHGQKLLEEICAFAAGEPQSDDMTLIFLRRH